MNIKNRVADAAEKLIPAYYQPDGTAFKMGEVLPPEHAAHFSAWLASSIERHVNEELIHNSESTIEIMVELDDEFEGVSIIPINGKTGQIIPDSTVTLGYTMGTRIDLDGDGK